MTRSFKIAATLVLLASIIMSLLFWFNFKEDNKENSNNPNNNPASKQQVGGVVIKEVLSPNEGKVEAVSGGKQYTHPSNWFSFVYPGDFTLAYLPDQGGDTLLLNGENKQIQVFCRDLGEAVTVTAEKIKTDIPDIQMSDIKTFKVAGATGVFFKDPSTGTSEAWFAKGNIFCQLSSLTQTSEIIDPIINGWKWR